jgi:hypothetical protein
MRHNSLEFIVEVGVGTLGTATYTTGGGEDPTVVHYGIDAVLPSMQLRYSDDGGKTWSHFISQPLGREGAWNTRVVFDQLGDSYGRIYEASTHHPVEFTIIDAFIDWDFS